MPRPTMWGAVLASTDPIAVSALAHDAWAGHSFVEARTRATPTARLSVSMS